MDHLYILAIIAGVMAVGFGILLTMIVSENIDNIESWRQAAENWWRSKTGKVMRP